MRPWALIGVASLVLLFFLTSCAEENCDELEDSFFFGKDDCWADKAKDSRDPTICAEKVSSSINKFTCFTGVAAEAQDVKICADYLAYLEKTGSAPVTKVSEYDVCVIAVAKAKGDVNVCAQNLKDKKGRMEQCARDVNQAKVSARVEACKKQSQAKADLCLIEVAKEFKDGSVCSFTSLESKGVCVIALAEELEDPKPILDNYVAGARCLGSNLRDVLFRH